MSTTHTPIPTAPFVGRYVVGRPGHAEAHGGLVYADLALAQTAAAQAGLGTTVLSARWVQRQCPALRLRPVFSDPSAHSLRQREKSRRFRARLRLAARG